MNLSIRGAAFQQALGKIVHLAGRLSSNLLGQVSRSAIPNASPRQIKTTFNDVAPDGSDFDGLRSSQAGTSKSSKREVKPGWGVDYKIFKDPFRYRALSKSFMGMDPPKFSDPIGKAEWLIGRLDEKQQSPDRKLSAQEVIFLKSAIAGRWPDGRDFAPPLSRADFTTALDVKYGVDTPLNRGHKAEVFRVLRSALVLGASLRSEFTRSKDESFPQQIATLSKENQALLLLAAMPLEYFAEERSISPLENLSGFAVERNRKALMSKLWSSAKKATAEKGSKGEQNRYFHSPNFGEQLRTPLESDWLTPPRITQFHKDERAFQSIDLLQNSAVLENAMKSGQSRFNYLKHSLGINFPNEEFSKNYADYRQMLTERFVVAGLNSEGQKVALDLRTKLNKVGIRDSLRNKDFHADRASSVKQIVDRWKDRTEGALKALVEEQDGMTLAEQSMLILSVLPVHELNDAGVAKYCSVGTLSTLLKWAKGGDGAKVLLAKPDLLPPDRIEALRKNSGQSEKNSYVISAERGGELEDYLVQEHKVFEIRQPWSGASTDPTLLFGLSNKARKNAAVLSKLQNAPSSIPPLGAALTAKNLDVKQAPDLTRVLNGELGVESHNFNNHAVSASKPAPYPEDDHGVNSERG